MKQGLVRLLYNLGKVHGVDITHDNVCSSMLSCFYSHLLSTGRPISSCIFRFYMKEGRYRYVVKSVENNKIEPRELSGGR